MAVAVALRLEGNPFIGYVELHMKVVAKASKYYNMWLFYSLRTSS
jgi:hypothetical protein